MKIEITPQNDHQVQLKVEVDPEQLEAEKKRAATRISKRTKIPGFRPGKAPYPVVLRTVGEAAILEDALDKMVDNLYPQVIKESEIDPYGPGSLEDYSLEDGLPVFEFLVPLTPEVKLGDYRSIRIPYNPPVITEEQIDRVLEDVRENQAIIEPVDRKAREGDLLHLQIELRRSEIPEDGNPVLIPLQPIQYLLEPQENLSEEAWPFPGFSQQLVGHASGEELTFQHTFSEDAEIEDLRNADADVWVKLDRVNSRTLPDLNDEFAQTVGDFESLTEMRDHIRNVLETNSLEEYHSNYDDQIISAIREISTFQYPPQLLARELEVAEARLKDLLARNNLDLEIYLKTRDMDEEQLHAELEPVARERIERGLLVLEIAKEENIEVDPDEVQGEATRTIDQYLQIVPPREARRRLSADMIQGLVSQIMGERMTQHTMARLREITSLEEESAGADETVTGQLVTEVEEAPEVSPDAEMILETEMDITPEGETGQS